MHAHAIEIHNFDSKCKYLNAAKKKKKTTYANVRLCSKLNSLEFEMRVAINQLLHRAQVVCLASADEAFQGWSAVNLVARIYYAGLTRLKSFNIYCRLIENVVKLERKKISQTCFSA